MPSASPDLATAWFHPPTGNVYFKEDGNYTRAGDIDPVEPPDGLLPLVPERPVAAAALRWAADRIDPGPAAVTDSITGDLLHRGAIAANRGTAHNLRFWAQQVREGNIHPVAHTPAHTKMCLPLSNCLFGKEQDCDCWCHHYDIEAAYLRAQNAALTAQIATLRQRLAERAARCEQVETQLRAYGQDETAQDGELEYLVFSHEYHSWWRSGGGYTRELSQAGRFTYTRAVEACNTRTWEKDRPCPPEVMIKAPPRAVQGQGAELERALAHAVDDVTADAIARRTARWIAGIDVDAALAAHKAASPYTATEA